MSHNVYMLDRIVRQQKATFDMTIFSIAVRPIHVFPNQSPVFRVNPLENTFYRGLGGSVVSIDSEGFFRPEHLSCGEPATEAASQAQSLRFRQVRFTSSEGLLRPLLFAQVEDKHDAFVRTLKQRASNQHGQAAAIFPEKLLLVWLKNPGRQCLCQGTFVALAQFGRRQIRPAQSTRDEILTAVLQ